MSRKSPAEFSELFERSPTPESPAELDHRILDYARRNAPQPARSRQPLFLTTAATLSVACIGLLVVCYGGKSANRVSESDVPAAIFCSDTSLIDDRRHCYTASLIDELTIFVSVAITSKREFGISRSRGSRSRRCYAPRAGSLSVFRV
ncbi:MAG: hypothetical protein ACR2P1_17615 [Pseudomonadales bacterium]